MNDDVDVDDSDDNDNDNDNDDDDANPCAVKVHSDDRTDSL